MSAATPRRASRKTAPATTTAPVLVTGGSGFFGGAVVEALVRAGLAVRVLARGPSAKLAALGVEQIVGDVTRDLDGALPLAAACQGASALFHLAGFVSRSPEDGQRMMRVHIDGTRRIFAAAAAAGVRRVVLASTSGTIAVSREPVVLDERAPYPTDLVGGWPYYLSKIYQEKLGAELGAELGLEVVTVNPSLLLGPGDERQSSTGDVRRFLRRQIPIVPEGGVNFVDVRDAAQATVAALSRGRAGERYLLGGPNWSCAEFFGRLERVAKVRGPRLRLPPRVTENAAALMAHLYRAFDKEPPIERASVEMGQLYWWCNSAKAERELGFVAREPAETLDDTVRDLRTRMI